MVRSLARHVLTVRRWILAGVVAGLFVTGLFAVQAWNRPLGPQLVTIEPTGTAVSADLRLSATREELPTIVQIEALPTSTAEPTSQPLCEGPPVMFLLLVGKDTPSDDYATGFADVIRIARVDFIDPSVTLLALPRDLSARVYGLERHGIVEGRLRTVYAYGYAYDVPGGGPSLLAQTLMLNFGFRIDHYVVANFAAFEAGIDAIGGIDIEVPESVGDFSAGAQHMDGRAALAYARIRDQATDSSDLSRIDRQTQVIRAVQTRILSPQVLTAVPELAQSMRGAVLTDLSPSDISTLVCLGQRLGAEAIQTMNIDNNMFTSQTDARGHEILIPDYQAIGRFTSIFDTRGAP